MEKQISANYIKASNFIFFSARLSLINLYFIPNQYPLRINILATIIGLLFFGGMGLLIRRGVKWIKYVLRVLIILGIFGVPSFIKSHTLFANLIFLIQSAAQIWAVILLFKKNKTDMIEDTALE